MTVQGNKYAAALGGTTLTDKGAKQVDKTLQQAAKRKLAITYGPGNSKVVKKPPVTFPGQKAVTGVLTTAGNVGPNIGSLVKAVTGKKLPKWLIQ